MKEKTCIALFSGGLDSLLAVKIIKEQGIDIISVYFNTGFFFNSIVKEKDKFIYKGKIPEDFDLKIIDISEDFYKMLKLPEHGFGKNMNPCIDCKILMLKKARELLSEYNAGFVITGEVLGQRPMTQNIHSMRLIEEKSGLSGYLLRPLSAKNLPETIPEKMKWVDRDKLFDFQGRTRKPQLKLAEQLNLSEYIKSPAGGCILTDHDYSRRLKDFMEDENDINYDDVFLLTQGRYFKYNKIKFIIGRNQKENEYLLNYKSKKNIYFFDTEDVPGPVCVAFGDLNKEEKQFIASAVARYSDAKESNVVKILVCYKDMKEVLEVKPVDDKILKTYLI